MAAFTSKANGNWSSGGQTTWTQVGVPTAGDTVTINNIVTVDVNSKVGDGSATALVISLGDQLIVASNVTLSVHGGIVNNAAISLTSAGSSILFTTFGAVVVYGSVVAVMAGAGASMSRHRHVTNIGGMVG
jgi:hypothetical protein